MILRIKSRVKKREGVNSSRLRHPQLLLANNASLHHRFIINIITITPVITYIFNIISSPSLRHQHHHYMSQLLLLGKVEYGGGPIFKVVLEC